MTRRLRHDRFRSNLRINAGRPVMAGLRPSSLNASGLIVVGRGSPRCFPPSATKPDAVVINIECCNLHHQNNH
jgi:hypothetical protein